MPPCWAKAVGANARTVAAAVAITYLWIIGSSLVDASVRHTGDADAGGLDTLIEVDSQCLPADGMCAAAENPTSARPGWGSSQVNLHDFSVHGEHLIGICDMPGCLLHVGFSNRPFWVKHFQAIHHRGVDVAGSFWCASAPLTSLAGRSRMSQKEALTEAQRGACTGTCRRRRGRRPTALLWSHHNGLCAASGGLG